MDKKIIAICGPSGSGKTTLTENLLSYYDILIPTHTTTRPRRLDDKEGFYRYLSLEMFEDYKKNHQFLIHSGAKDRCYGVLLQDCFEVWQKTDTILLNVSYKDIDTLSQLPFDVSLIVLTFRDIQSGILSRITKGDRNLSSQEIEARIKGALLDHETYFSTVKQCAKVIVYTDEMEEEETLKQVEQVLGYHRQKKVLKK